MTEIITSFDIGLRNLSYCRLNYVPSNPPGSQFPVHDWNLIDLLGETADLDKHCQSKYQSGAKNGQKCGNDAHFYYMDKSSAQVSKPVPVCKTHSKAHESKGLKRLYTCGNITLFELAKLAVQRLDQIDFSQCTEVIFELQPKIAHPLVKDFSKMLFNYFVIRYFAEVPEESQTIKNVQFISARNKLTVYDGPYIECTLKSQYSRNKFYGKAYCQYLLRHNPEKLVFFNSFKKKDDLADSFLQGAWYLMNNYKPSALAKIPRIKLQLKPKMVQDEVPIRNHLIEDPEDPEAESEVRVKPKIQLKSKRLEQLATTPIIQAPAPLLVLPFVSGPEPGPNLTKPKIRLELKPRLIGKHLLKAIKHNDTTQMIHHDYNLNRYRNLKKSLKPKKNAYRYTLSNLKYVMNVNRGQPPSGDSAFDQALKFYFGSPDKFISMFATTLN